MKKEIIVDTIALPISMEAFCKRLSELAEEHPEGTFVRGNGRTMTVFTTVDDSEPERPAIQIEGPASE